MNSRKDEIISDLMALSLLGDTLDESETEAFVDLLYDKWYEGESNENE